MVPQAGVIAMLDHGPYTDSETCLAILIYVLVFHPFFLHFALTSFLEGVSVCYVGVLMGEKPCSHDELDFLGSQRTEGGENLYFRCKKCGGVLIVLPGGKRGFIIPGHRKD